MHLRYLFTLFILQLNLAYAQDEKAFRDLLMHSRKNSMQIEETIENGDFKVRSPRYRIDMFSNKRAESFYTAKVDGRDWLTIFDDQQKQVFRYNFEGKGPWGRIYKVQKRKLSDNTNIFIFYYYEGITRYIEFKGTARIYFLTVDNNDVNSLSMYKGPTVWFEHRNQQDNLMSRKYEVSLFDFENDNIREVAVRFHDITRVYKYMGKGKWARPQGTNIAGY